MLAGIVSPTTPFIGEQPNKNISLCVYADETGLRTWNYKGDPMPIKTINMAGLQKWEETDDYIIYLDKDAVMTTVAQYVTGSYDKFLEIKANVDSSKELLKLNGIEWTAEDDSKLLLDINKVQLERIANTPATMEEEDFTTQTFTTRAVPTTYECCFRVDKSSGEIYIGEGYENLWSKSNFETSKTVRVSVDLENNRVKLTQISPAGSSVFNFYRSVIPNFDGKSTYTSSCFIEKMTTSSYVMYVGNRLRDYMINTTYLKSEIARGGATYFGIGLDNLAVVGEEIEAKHFQITKTSTPKPFVKSIMPSGKLAFVTSATSKTHSFVMKENKHTNEEFYSSFYIKGYTSDCNHIRSTTKLNNTGDFLVSNKYKQLISDIGNFSLVEANYFDSGVLNFAYINPVTESFKQLLIYKGNLTEEELKAENNKNIRLNDGYSEYFNIRRDI